MVLENWKYLPHILSNVLRIIIRFVLGFSIGIQQPSNVSPTLAFLLWWSVSFSSSRSSSNLSSESSLETSLENKPPNSFPLSRHVSATKPFSGLKYFGKFRELWTRFCCSICWMFGAISCSLVHSFVLLFNRVNVYNNRFQINGMVEQEELFIFIERFFLNIGPRELKSSPYPQKYPQNHHQICPWLLH